MHTNLKEFVETTVILSPACEVGWVRIALVFHLRGAVMRVAGADDNHESSGILSWTYNYNGLGTFGLENRPNFQRYLIPKTDFT